MPYTSKPFRIPVRTTAGNPDQHRQRYASPGKGHVLCERRRRRPVDRQDTAAALRHHASAGGIEVDGPWSRASRAHDDRGHDRRRP